VSNKDVSNTEIREPKTLTRLKMAAAGVTAIGTIAASLVALIHWLPGHHSVEPAVSQSGTVERAAFTPHGTSATADTRVTVVGQEGKSVRVVWTIFDAGTSKPLQEPGFKNHLLAAFKPTTNDFTRDFSGEVPAPTSPPTDLVFLRVRLLDEAGTELDFSDSDLFRLGNTPG
jgi:hypothetical protein